MEEETRKKIMSILDQHRIMTVATLRPDGWPQATTVGYANDGMTLYFLCGKDSQKAANLARDDRVSLTVDHDTPEVMEITGLSMAARAQRVVDPAEGQKALDLLMRKYPQPQEPLPFAIPTPDEVAIVRLTPVVTSVLDCTKGFAHTDLVVWEGASPEQAGVRGHRILREPQDRHFPSLATGKPCLTSTASAAPS